MIFAHLLEGVQTYAATQTITQKGFQLFRLQVTLKMENLEKHRFWFQ